MAKQGMRQYKPDTYQSPTVPAGHVIESWSVTKDGQVKFTGTNSECFGWVLSHQGQSVSYATTYGGYAIVPNMVTG